MKIKTTGNISVAQFKDLVSDVIDDFLEQAEVDPETVELDSPILQTGFRINGGEPVVMTTGHDEMLQVSIDLKDGEVITQKDNEHEPTEDRRLWSNDKVMNEAPTEVTDEEITSDFDSTQVEFVKEFVINSSLKQKVYRIKDTDEELIRYFNTDKHILIAEEVVAKGETE